MPDTFSIIFYFWKIIQESIQTSEAIKQPLLSKEMPNTVKRFVLNGEEILDKKIKLIDNGRIYEVLVEL